MKFINICRFIIGYFAIFFSCLISIEKNAFSSNSQDYAKCFIGGFLPKIQQIQKTNNRDLFIGLISEKIDYIRLSKRILATLIRDKKVSESQFIELQEIIKKIIEQCQIAKAFNPHIEYISVRVVFVGGDFSGVIISIKLPDGKILELNYTMRCLLADKDSKFTGECNGEKYICSITDLAVEGIRVSDVYADDIKTFVENSNPSFEQIKNHLKEILKKK